MPLPPKVAGSAAPWQTVVAGVHLPRVTPPQPHTQARLVVEPFETMLPPDDHARIFAQLLDDFRAGRRDPEMHSPGSTIALSQFVRIDKTVAALGGAERLPATLAHFGVSAEDWSRAEGTWRAFGYVLEIHARTSYWHETLDVNADVAEIRRKHAYR